MAVASSKLLGVARRNCLTMFDHMAKAARASNRAATDQDQFFKNHFHFNYRPFNQPIKPLTLNKADFLSILVREMTHLSSKICAFRHALMH